MKILRLFFSILIIKINARILESTTIGIDNTSNTVYYNNQADQYNIKRDTNSQIQKTTGKINVAEKTVTENTTPEGPQNYPFFGVDEDGGLQKFGQLVQNMFHVSPNQLYGDDFDEILEDMKDASKKENEVVMLSPQVLQTILYHLQDFKKKKEEQENKKAKQKKRDETLNKSPYKLQKEFVEQKQKENKIQLGKIEEKIKQLDRVILKMRMEKQEKDMEEKEKEKKDLEEQQEYLEEQKDVLQQEDDILKNLIDLTDEDLMLQDKNREQLEKLKQRLEEELKNQMDKEDSKKQIQAIEKKIEEIEEILAKMDSQDKEKLEKLKDMEEELKNKEQEIEDKIQIKNIETFNGKMSIEKLIDIKRIINDYVELLTDLYDSIPTLDFTKQSKVQFMTNVEAFERTLRKQLDLMDKVFMFFRKKMQEINFSSQGMLEFLEKDSIYQDIRVMAVQQENNFYEMDKKLHEKLEDQIQTLNAIARSVDRVIFSHEKMKSMMRFTEQGEGQTPAKQMEDKFNKKQELIKELMSDKINIMEAISSMKQSLDVIRDKKQDIGDILIEMKQIIADNVAKRGTQQSILPISTDSTSIKFASIFGITLIILV